jgi:hypothetical protein
VPDGDGVARDVTRDPVPVGDRLEILRTHPKLLLNGLVAENPHYLSPDDDIAARLGRNERWRGLGRAGRDELTNAELAAEASLAQPTLATGASTGSTPSGVGGDSWATNGPHAPTGPGQPGPMAATSPQARDHDDSEPHGLQAGCRGSGRPQRAG